MRRAMLCAAIAASSCVNPGSHAAVTISSDSTQNMSCSGGVCAPTATDAVLNDSDLENLLASGNVEVTTAGKEGVQAIDIDVTAAFGWSSASKLSLDSFESIAAERVITASGSGGLSLVTNDGGTGGILSFGKNGSVVFQNLSSQLTINGTAYTLVNSISSLATDIESNPSGAYALANSYDASADGTYASSPIATILTGSFEGLGNAVSKLSIKTNDPFNYIGLFEEIGIGGSVANIRVTNVRIRGKSGVVGGLAMLNEGTIQNSSVTGAVRSNSRVIYSDIGGLVGVNSGNIVRSSASATVVGGNAFAGGLVGTNSSGVITECYSIGDVSSGSAGKRPYVGGLAGANGGLIEQSYSTGNVSIAADRIAIGGLVGDNEGMIAQTYSTGTVGSAKFQGGLIGLDTAASGSIASSYWDTTTSGITDLDQGAGRPRNDPGITGQTTEQLQSGLPAGFDPAIWGEKPNINGGLPYLLANSPKK